jgi:hypothetical protein
MSGNKKRQLVRGQRKAPAQKTSAESTTRKQKRKEKGGAEETAKAIQRGLAGRKAAEALKAKKGEPREKEQANYRKTRARAAARMGRRRKQIDAESQAKVEE